ncbi:unnamed protein product, partial [Staurois parvus]
RVRNNQADKVPKEQAGEWSRNSRGQDRQSSLTIRIKQNQESGRKQTGCRYRGSWETYTKALTEGLAIP